LIIQTINGLAGLATPTYSRVVFYLRIAFADNWLSVDAVVNVLMS
jgi:hypothetical protein